jgi:hypothetical protein
VVAGLLDISRDILAVITQVGVTVMVVWNCSFVLVSCLKHWTAVGPPAAATGVVLLLSPQVALGLGSHPDVRNLLRDLLGNTAAAAALTGEEAAHLGYHA